MKLPDTFNAAIADAARDLVRRRWEPLLTEHTRSAISHCDYEILMRLITLALRGELDARFDGKGNLIPNKEGDES